PLRHAVGLARCFVGVANPIFRFRQWWFTGTGRFVIFKFWRNERQFAFAQRVMPAIFPEDRKRLAPVTQARKTTVPQFVSDRARALTSRPHPLRDLLSRLRRREANDA